MLRKHTLLYLASGPYHKIYEDLPYEKIILVDRSKNNTTIPKNSKVEYWNMDALDAIDKIKARKLKIDCLVSLNDGMFEGGGSYPIFSDFLLGYLHPFLSDELLVVIDLNYYRALRLRDNVFKMNWGFKKNSQVAFGNEHFINPSIFSCGNRGSNIKSDSELGSVFHLQRNRQITSSKIENFEISIRNTSIWEDSEDLDFIGLSFPSHDDGFKRAFGKVQSDFFYKKCNTYPILHCDFNAIIEDCCNKGYKKIGFVPWLNGHYDEVVDFIRQNDCKHKMEICFYHLNKEDFTQIRFVLIDYFFKAFPSLFEHIAACEDEKKDFQQVLTAGLGKSINSLCEKISHECSKIYFDQTIIFNHIGMKENQLLILLNFNKNKKINQLVNELLRIEN
jgi:hypothetical protein